MGERTTGAFADDMLTAEFVALAHDSGLRPEDEESDDGVPLYEILQGCVWRDAESARQKAGLFDDEYEAAGFAEPDRWKELDFNYERRRARGFLDEDPPCFSARDDVFGRVFEEFD